MMAPAAIITALAADGSYGWRDPQEPELWHLDCHPGNNVSILARPDNMTESGLGAVAFPMTASYPAKPSCYKSKHSLTVKRPARAHVQNTLLKLREMPYTVTNSFKRYVLLSKTCRGSLEHY
jgi:hypothetical protein